MTISAADFAKSLSYTVPTGDERYVVPSASTGLKMDAGTTLPITAVVAGAGGTFTVNGDYRSYFTTGLVFRVLNSTGNNGLWTVASSAFTSGNTVITVVGSQTVGATADGYVTGFSTARDSGTKYTHSGSSLTATTAEDWFGDMRETRGGVSFNPADPTTFNAGFVAGYQVVDVGGNKLSGTATSLVPATTYTASVLIDGTITLPLNVLGSTAQTFGTLVAEVGRQLGNDAVVSLTGGNIKIASAKANKGSSSAIAITAGTLFAAPLAGFSSVLTAIQGITPFTGMTFNKPDGNVNSVLIVANKTTFDPLLATGTAEVTNVTITTASIAGGDYWLLNSPTVAYYVWYTVDAAGADPAPAGKTAIPVAILSGDTNAQAATKTALAIDGLADFVCPPPGANIITITDAVAGSAVDAADFNAGVSVSVTTQGVTALSGGYIPAP